MERETHPSVVRHSHPESRRRQTRIRVGDSRSVRVPPGSTVTLEEWRRQQQEETDGVG